MAMKHGLMKTAARLAPIEACQWRESPRWLGALYTIRGGADEATLEDLLDDPVAEAAMRADDVKPTEVTALFERLRRRREAQQG